MKDNITQGEKLIKALDNVSKQGRCLSVSFHTFGQSKGMVSVFGEYRKDYKSKEDFIAEWVNGPPSKQ